MKKIFLWIFIGIILTSIFWLGLFIYLNRARDYSENVSKDLTKNSSYLSFLKKSYCYNFGPLRILIPAEKESPFLAFIYMKDEPHKPLFVFGDSNSDGKLNTLDIIDQKDHMFSILDKNGDAIWDQYSYSSGFSPDSLDYFDRNMDGLPDTAVSPNGKILIYINSKWYNLITEEKIKYIRINGKLRQVESKDGIWELIE